MRPPRTCIDCKIEYPVAAKGNISERCPECRARYRRNRRRAYARAYIRDRYTSKVKSRPGPSGPGRHRNPKVISVLDDYNAMRRNREVRPLCLGREAEFVDYEVPPSAEAAKEMCRGCPVFDLCDSYATKVQRPTWGVWAGRVWVESDVDVTRGVLTSG